MLSKSHMIRALSCRVDKYTSLIAVLDKGLGLDETVHELDEYLTDTDRISIKNILKESIKIAIDKVEAQIEVVKLEPD